MRWAFVTCVEIGRRSLEALLKAGHKPVAVFSLPSDFAQKKSGRSDMATWCEQASIPLFEFRNINEPEAVEQLKALELDVLFIIGWSQIAKPEVIETASKMTIGAHPSLLPRGRGRAAVPWAILLGLEETGITIFQIDPGVDTGLILHQVKIPLPPEADAAWLYEQVCVAHEEGVIQVLEQILAGTVQGQAQDPAQATFWPGRKPADGEIHPSCMSVHYVEKLVRAVTRPYPGAFVIQDGRKYTIWRCSPDIVREPFTPGVVESGDRLLLQFVDGQIQAIDWEVETIPPSEG
ncbi:MAG: methionyl-tRNA formyltransferase [Fimbriimonadaceae bacterium]